MNNDCFRLEMHDYLDNLYDEFEIYQNHVLDTLLEFHRLCQQNDINYYTGFGSLLGIVRGGNILPWDYDIDVVVPITEKNKLLSVLHNELNPEYYFYCADNDKKCRHYCIRITKKGYDSSAIHMDIFFLIGAPEDKAKRERFRRLVKRINIIRKSKLVNSKQESMGVNTIRFGRNLKKLLYFPVPIACLDVFYNYLINKVDYESAKYVTTMQAAADTYEKYIFNIPSKIDIEGKSVNAPSDIEGFLNSTYNNYMSLPPIKSRFDECYQSIKRIQFFNNDKLLGKHDFQINKY